MTSVKSTAYTSNIIAADAGPASTAPPRHSRPTQLPISPGMPQILPRRPGTIDTRKTDSVGLMTCQWGGGL